MHDDNVSHQTTQWIKTYGTLHKNGFDTQTYKVVKTRYNDMSTTLTDIQQSNLSFSSEWISPKKSDNLSLTVKNFTINNGTIWTYHLVKTEFNFWNDMLGIERARSRQLRHQWVVLWTKTFLISSSCKLSTFTFTSLRPNAAGKIVLYVKLTRLISVALARTIIWHIINLKRKCNILVTGKLTVKLSQQQFSTLNKDQ